MEVSHGMFILNIEEINCYNGAAIALCLWFKAEG